MLTKETVTQKIPRPTVAYCVSWSLFNFKTQLHHFAFVSLASNLPLELDCRNWNLYGLLDTEEQKETTLFSKGKNFVILTNAI